MAKEKNQTNDSVNETPEKKRPILYLFMDDGRGNTERVGAAFAHEKGDGMNILIGNRRYSAFKPKPKQE